LVLCWGRLLLFDLLDWWLVLGITADAAVNVKAPING